MYYYSGRTARDVLLLLVVLLVLSTYIRTAGEKRAKKWTSVAGGLGDSRGVEKYANRRTVYGTA